MITFIVAIVCFGIGHYMGYLMYYDMYKNQKRSTDYWFEGYKKMKEAYFKLLDEHYDDGDEWKKLLK